MKIKFKRTPIFFLSIFSIPFLAFIGMKYMLFDTQGGVTLLGAFALLCLFINIMILSVEQFFLKKINALKKVWIVEITLILLVILFSIYFSD